MKASQDDKIRQQVRESYAAVAEAEGKGVSCGNGNSCCGIEAQVDQDKLFSTRLGYSEEDVNLVPDGADMGLGCGNPKAIAELQAGETVLDLGSGGGFDAFLAAREVGQGGWVIGVDMTPAMLSKARANADKAGFGNVEFRLGEIENLPVADQSVDVIISNCVINLSPNKARVFAEAMRVLRPGGRLAISDVVATAPLPPEVRDDMNLYSACVGGASLIDELQSLLQQNGFCEISITPKDESREFIRDWAPTRPIEEYVVSAYIQARRPAN